MHSMIAKGIATALALVLLAGCVTTTSGGGNVKVDKDKALNTHIQLGLSYIRNRNLDLARHHFIKAFDINPNAEGAHNGRALLYQLEGEPALAEKHFKKALDIDPAFTQARNNYGSFLYQNKRYPEAYRAFELAAADLEYSRRAIALLSLGRTALKLNKLDKAEAAFSQALVLQPRLAPAMAELAEINFNKKAYADAKKYLEQYASISRQSPRTLWLGIRLERIFGNRDKEASYALALKNLHPYSKEYLEYQRLINSQPQQKQ